MHYIINELGQEYSIKPLQKLHPSTMIAVGASAALVLLPEGPRGSDPAVICCGLCSGLPISSLQE